MRYVLGLLLWTLVLVLLLGGCDPKPGDSDGPTYGEAFPVEYFFWVH